MIEGDELQYLYNVFLNNYYDDVDNKEVSFEILNKIISKYIFSFEVFMS